MHDERLKETIPAISECVSEFFEPIMSTFYSIQSEIYQHLYNSVKEYANDHHLSKTDDLEEECYGLFEPIRDSVERDIPIIREGKTAQTPMGQQEAKPGLFGRISNPISRPASKSVSSTNYSSTRKTTLSSPPAASSPIVMTPSSRSPSESSMSSEAKRKGPPVPPPRPTPSPTPEFVTALYDFESQGEGDLSFKAGDRIRVVKKTNSVEDWWDGELNGVTGTFPRNYCD
jgi:amphiphysin